MGSHVHLWQRLARTREQNLAPHQVRGRIRKDPVVALHTSPYRPRAEKMPASVDDHQQSADDAEPLLKIPWWSALARECQSDPRHSVARRRTTRHRSQAPIPCSASHARRVRSVRATLVHVALQ